MEESRVQLAFGRLLTVCMQPSGQQALPVPTSVLDFQKYGGIGKLHFKYDISVVASITDKVVAQLREDRAQLVRQLARSQEEAQSLLTELGRLQDENARLTKIIDGSLAQNSRVAQNARDVHAKAQEQLRTIQNTNRGLATELQGTRKMLEMERARTASATSAVVRLRVERNTLRNALRERETASASTSKVNVEEDAEPPDIGLQHRVSSSDTRPESPVLSPPSSAAPSSASVSPLVAIHQHPASSLALPSETLLSPLPSPPLIAPSIFAPSQPSQPLPPAQRTYSRPTVMSSVPRPSFVKTKDASSTTENGSAPPPPPATPTVSSPRILTSTARPSPPAPVSVADSPPIPSAGLAASSPRAPANSLKRKRSRDSETAKNDTDDDDIVLISGPTPARSRGASPSTHAAPAPAPVRSRASSPAARRSPQLPPRPQPQLQLQLQPRPQPQPWSQPQSQPQPSTNPGPPTPPQNKPKLGIKHLPLLYETRGNTMSCRTCKRAFPATAAWLDLVGHSQGTHADVCTELEMLRPVQVIEQTQRLQGFGAGVWAGAGTKKGKK
ncbi:hypothetical protein C8R45DRAFT_408153 [Mycena sanguinolenta]|nr:hypothetical protein C8R45DRAFT_408153 [Mycena sanguinolenta]